MITYAGQLLLHPKQCVSVFARGCLRKLPDALRLADVSLGVFGS